MTETNEQNLTYDSGAKRSKRNPRYRDIDIGFVQRVGNAFLEGAEKYEKDTMPYQKNWKNGDLYFALDVLDHLLEHAFAYKEVVLRKLNDDPRLDEWDNEDHLGHLGANCVMLDYFERRGFFDPANYGPDQTEDSAPAEPRYEGPLLEETPEETSPKPADETITDKLKRILAGLK